MIIDPGASAEMVADYIAGKGLRVKAIIATHAHIDHVISAPWLSRRFRAPFLVNRLDGALLSTLAQQGAALGYGVTQEVQADEFYDDKSSFQLGSMPIRVLHTPGHTPGSSCLFAGVGALFTGDTLFAGTIGRTDFPEGSPVDMNHSLRILTALPRAVKILSRAWRRLHNRRREDNQPFSALCRTERRLSPPLPWGRASAGIPHIGVPNISVGRLLGHGQLVRR